MKWKKKMTIYQNLGMLDMIQEAQLILLLLIFASASQIQRFLGPEMVRRTEKFFIISANYLHERRVSLRNGCLFPLSFHLCKRNKTRGGSLMC